MKPGMSGRVMIVGGATVVALVLVLVLVGVLRRGSEAPRASASPVAEALQAPASPPPPPAPPFELSPEARAALAAPSAATPEEIERGVRTGPVSPDMSLRARRQRELARHGGSVHRCIAAHAPDFEERYLVVQLDVDARGKPGAARLLLRAADRAALATCIGQALREVRFPATAAGETESPPAKHVFRIDGR